MSEHLAIMRQPWMGLIINGQKTIESRISQRRIAPWQKVQKGDWIYYRLSGQMMVTHKTQVKEVKYYQGPVIFDILEHFKHQIGIDSEYIQSKHKCRYLTLIWYNPVIELVEPCLFMKKDQRAWVCNFKKELNHFKKKAVPPVKTHRKKGLYKFMHGPPKQNLLILGCSKTKNQAEGLLPAIDRYTGIFFKVLKKNNPDFINLDVIILSAKYGILRPEDKIENYDQIMTKQRAYELQDQVTKDLQKLEIHQYDKVCVNLGKVYSVATYLGRNITGHNVQYLKGAPGERMAQLKQWLLQIQGKDKLRQFMIKTSSEVSQ